MMILDEDGVSSVRAARLTALSQMAVDQSVAAISHTLKLLRTRAYPDDMVDRARRPGPAGKDEMHGTADDEGHRRDRRIDG